MAGPTTRPAEEEMKKQVPEDSVQQGFQLLHRTDFFTTYFMHSWLLLLPYLWHRFVLAFFVRDPSCVTIVILLS